MILPGEGFRTVSTLEGCFASVLPDMIDEMFPPCEGLAAEVTPVRRLARVLTDVVQQVLLTGKRL